MPTYVLKSHCPHCNTSGVGFTGTDHIQTSAGHRIPLSCPHCGELIVAACVPNQRFSASQYPSDYIFRIGDGNSPLGHFKGAYPSRMERKVPESVPARIESVFDEALENLDRKRFETAVLLCGKALDLATKEMDQAWKLEKRLRTLAETGRITSDMADWAEEIRIDRNTAIHEDVEFTEKDAEDIAAFTSAFLTYIYTLPKLIESRRNRP